MSSIGGKLMPPPLQLFVDDRKGITKMKHDPEQQVSELYG
jgi:hypothetical protein